MMCLHATEYGQHLTTVEKPPLLILHGLFGSNRNWHPIARFLSTDRRVYTLDLPNHGQSAHTDVMDYPYMAEQVRHFIEHEIYLKSEHSQTPVDIIGHSMGGKVAMWLALNYPQQVNKLVVVDIAPVTYQHDFDHVLDAFDNVPLSQLKSRQDADHYLAQQVSDKNLRQFLLQNLIHKEGQYQWRLNLHVIQASIKSITGFPQCTTIKPFKQRVLFVGGALSDYLSKENQQLTRKCFPRASFSMIKNAGHWLHAEQPELFKALIKPYLL